jgi:hypothetical protein
MATAKHTLLCRFVHLHHIARLGFTLSCTMCKDQGCPLICSFFTESFPLHFDAEESQSFLLHFPSVYLFCYRTCLNPKPCHLYLLINFSYPLKKRRIVCSCICGQISLKLKFLGAQVASDYQGFL